MAKGSKYYGAYFWVAVASFVVPLFVGWKAFEKLAPTSKPEVKLDASGVDHEVWDYLLKNYVEDGLVDYGGMKKDFLFHDYVRQIGRCKPDALSTKEEKLALHCNAYNALVINGVITHKIEKSVQEFTGGDFFGVQEHIFAGKTISLNHLENELIRPVFHEPRIHVALVCAAKSCPALRPEAYRGDTVLEQLADQSRLFANNSTYVGLKKVPGGEQATAEDAAVDLLAQTKRDLGLNKAQSAALKSAYLQYSKELAEIDERLKNAIVNRLDKKQLGQYFPNRDKLVLSRILSWYGGDWDGKFSDGYLEWLEGLVEDAEVKEAIARVRRKEIGVTFAEYDWTLNSQAKPETVVKAKGGGFGSGSSPDE